MCSSIRVVGVRRIFLFMTEAVVVLGISFVIVIFGKDVMSDLRPCAATTTGCLPEESSPCEAGLWSLRPTFCPER